MGLRETIQGLYEERDRLQRVIALLEELQRTTQAVPKVLKRRGRKSMSAAERAEVSERMKQYWAWRRKNRAAGLNAGPGMPCFAKWLGAPATQNG
jgi:hypothetical protein